ncbi:alpha/beta-hydrolase family protein [Actinomadura sp. ATCC 31491]|uniref:Alpha/beta-hydrolase family protein n=1 Tax=Actinomadura luzonensis TaxID=2805427 RepID=A0ABT0FZ04_9ACTN|nr:alpha/beta-hydrolase family protein [Actinomadura luzonensis]MCK2217540.1 alpha/beta-hydrolase family protein [Actinomadura luzonensis]
MDTARVVRRWPGFGGALLGTLFACASLTPSLLPRTWLYQGVMGAVTGLLGYAVGASVGALYRAWFPYRLPERWRRTAWQVMIGACSALSLVALWYSYDWQRDLRSLMGMDTRITWFPPLILAVAVVLFTAGLLLSRLVRLGGRKLINWLDRFVPFYVGHAVGVLLVAFLVAVFANDVLFSAFVARVSDVSSVANQGTSPGVRRPASTLLSGGPGSLVAWEALGREGRNFIGTAATPGELAAFSGRPAAQPIRVYVGLDAGPTPQAQAALAVRELERAGAFERPVLAVLGTTGTGWVDPHIPDALEYMYNGRSALVALQYSYLPSWVSFLVDRTKAATAGRALVEAVRARWAALPAADRPKLLLAGESLGSYALENAFHDLGDLAAETDGAVFVGPPNANPIWHRVTVEREPGSPVWRPVYEAGRTVRFAQTPGDLARPPGPWARPRVVYLQNASDPVVWWTPALILRRPAWLEGERGPGVNPQMNWFPLVTFWQVLVDMTAALSVPPGHGHRYNANIVDAWAAVAAPDGWDGADTVRLRSLLSAS